MEKDRQGNSYFLRKIRVTLWLAKLSGRIILRNLVATFLFRRLNSTHMVLTKEKGPLQQRDSQFHLFGSLSESGTSIWCLRVPERGKYGRGTKARFDGRSDSGAVSYTHLTLPTILRV